MWYKKLVYFWTLRNNNNMKKYSEQKNKKEKAKYLHNVDCQWCGGIAFSIMYYNLGLVGGIKFLRWF